MDRIREGDMVTRRSYGEDIIFYVTKIEENGVAIAQLVGANVRLFADSPLTDLISVNYRQKSGHRSALKQIINAIIVGRSPLSKQLELKGSEPRTDYQVFPGKVLHIDGEQHYLTQCLELYKNLKVPVVGLNIREAKQPSEVRTVLEKHRPDILVITGHDGLVRKQSDRDRLVNYRSSGFFVEAVKQARLYETDKDGLVIIAGACQSHFEALIEAGANFASAPNRVMIHCFDPVFIAEKVSFTSFYHVLDMQQILQTTVSGINGIGGLETRGKMRLGYPIT